MSEYLLLKSQKNEIFKLIKNEGSDPANFIWTEIDSFWLGGEAVNMIEYTNSDFFFRFDFRSKENYCSYSPGKGRKVDEKLPRTWEGMKACFRDWLSYIRREIDQPDFWADIAKYQIPVDSETKGDVANEPFTAYQAEQIIESLNNVRAFLYENELVSEEHQTFVEDKLNYLEEAVKRQGRLDWIYTCIGAFTTIAVALALSPEQTNTIWGFIKSTIAGLSKLLQ